MSGYIPAVAHGMMEKHFHEFQADRLIGHVSHENQLVGFFVVGNGINNEFEMTVFIQIQDYGILIVLSDRTTFDDAWNGGNKGDISKKVTPFEVLREPACKLKAVEKIGALNFCFAKETMRF
jgi:hypothetical protein